MIDPNFGDDFLDLEQGVGHPMDSDSKLKYFVGEYSIDLNLEVDDISDLQIRKKKQKMKGQVLREVALRFQIE